MDKEDHEAPIVVAQKTEFSPDAVAGDLVGLDAEGAKEALGKYDEGQLVDILDALEKQDAAAKDQLAVIEAEVAQALNRKEQEPILDVLRLGNEVLEKMMQRAKAEEGDVIFKVTTPAGKQVAVMIEKSDGIVDTQLIVFPDGKTEGSRRHALLLPTGWDLENQIRRYKDFRPDILKEKSGLYSERAQKYGNFFDYHFAGDGFSHHSQNLSKVFEAFGLKKEMPAAEKLKTILVAINGAL